MEKLKNSVNALYEYRDNFFNIHQICEASDKPQLMKAKLAEVLERFEEVDDSLKTKAEYFMMKGKALNVIVEYDSQAEALLSKAVKLNPMLSEAWICLGDCYWKNDKFDAAKDCFVSSMSHKKNKEALRYLSTITRVVSREERSVDDSLQMAKEALQMDLNDGMSWLTLGNAFLAKYFRTLQDPTIIKQALSAYNHAEQDSTTKHDFTLYYNKGSTCEYLENFEQALSLYNSCNQLNPTFTEGQKKEASLLKYLNDVTTMVRTKAKMRKKRIKALVDKINSTLDMGTFEPTFTKDTKDCFKTIKQLLEGPNPKCLLVGRVVGSVFSEGRVCQTFFLVDKDSQCTSVMTYNASPKWVVNVGDAVVINEPAFKQVCIRHHTSSTPSNFEFTAVRVDSPSHLLVNARKPNDSSIAPGVLTFTQSE